MTQGFEKGTVVVSLVTAQGLHAGGFYKVLGTTTVDKGPWSYTALTVQGETSGRVYEVVNYWLVLRNATAAELRTALGPRLSEVEARKISGPHAPGCSHCRQHNLCNVCGANLSRWDRCTNGRCLACHRTRCVTRSDDPTVHGYGTV